MIEETVAGSPERHHASFQSLPNALERKYPNAAKEWGWQFVFPAAKLSTDPHSGMIRRHHLHESVLQRAVREAVAKAGISKPASCHTLRHSFATHERDADPQEADIWDRTGRVSRSRAKMRGEKDPHPGSGGQRVWKTVSRAAVERHGSDLR